MNTALEIQPPHVPASDNELVLVGMTRSWLGRGVRFSLGIATTNLDSVFNSRDITLRIRVHPVKAMVLPGVIYRCKSWIIKKAECQSIDAFELWCWRRLLRVPWIARRSKQSILKEIGPEYPLEGLMLKLKLQYFGYLM